MGCKALHLQVDDVGHGLLVSQVLNVLSGVRLRAADEISGHFVIIEAPLWVVLVGVAILPPHLPATAEALQSMVMPSMPSLHAMESNGMLCRSSCTG